jgi:hypothetical protein
MRRNGYVMYQGYSLELPGDWAEKANRLNRAYSNGPAEIFSWRGAGP